MGHDPFERLENYITDVTDVSMYSCACGSSLFMSNPPSTTANVRQSAPGAKWPNALSRHATPPSGFCSFVLDGVSSRWHVAPAENHQSTAVDRLSDYEKGVLKQFNTTSQFMLRRIQRIQTLQPPTRPEKEASLLSRSNPFTQNKEAQQKRGDALAPWTHHVQLSHVGKKLTSPPDSEGLADNIPSSFIPSLLAVSRPSVAIFSPNFMHLLAKNVQGNVAAECHRRKLPILQEENYLVTRSTKAR